MSILQTLLYFIKDITAVAAAAVVLRCLLGYGGKVRVLPAGCMVFAFGVEAAAGFYIAEKGFADYAAWLDLVSGILVIISCFVFAKGVKPKTAVLTVLVTSSAADMLYSLMRAYLNETFTSELIFYTAVQVAATAALLVVSEKANIKPFVSVFGDLPPFFFSAIIIFEFICYYREFGERSGFYRIVYIAVSLMMFGCIAYLAYKILAASAKQKEILTKMEEQKDFAEDLIKNDDEMRRFRHDYKNHMTVVRALLDSGRTDEAERYLASITKNADTIVSNRSTGNFVADTILNNKRSEAARNGIGLDFDGSIPENGIANEDLCTVLANLIDNAIEYCRTYDGQTRIEVLSVRKNSDILLSVENPVRDDVKISSVQATSKTDKRSHGFGLKNVERVARKYHGALTFSCIDGKFRADVRLRLEDNTAEKEEENIIRLIK